LEKYSDLYLSKGAYDIIDLTIWSIDYDVKWRLLRRRKAVCALMLRFAAQFFFAFSACSFAASHEEAGFDVSLLGALFASLSVTPPLSSQFLETSGRCRAAARFALPPYSLALLPLL
jgi:hypothetical protein